MGAIVKVGISSWTEKTLVQSGWYPPGSKNAEARLRFYAERFPLAEVDAPYYALPTRHQAEVWAERTPAGFTFNVKAHALMTAHYTDPRRLPADLQEALPPALRAKAKLYPHEVGPEFVKETARRFTEAIEPLRTSGKLGVVLFQYPVWFPCSRESRRRLVEVRALAPGLRVAVEFRNDTWLSPRNRADTLRFLREHNLIYTCVDEPQGFPSSVPPVAAATSALAVVRFHGRNLGAWGRPTTSAAERMDHLYTTEELRQWVPSLRRLATETDEVHVVMNNCHRDYAVRNATEMAGLLAAQGVDRIEPRVPPPERVGWAIAERV